MKRNVNSSKKALWCTLWTPGKSWKESKVSHKDTQALTFTTYCLDNWELGFSLRSREPIARAGQSTDLDVPVESRAPGGEVHL